MNCVQKIWKGESLWRKPFNERRALFPHLQSDAPRGERLFPKHVDDPGDDRASSCRKIVVRCVGCHPKMSSTIEELQDDEGEPLIPRVTVVRQQLASDMLEDCFGLGESELRDPTPRGSECFFGDGDRFLAGGRSDDRLENLTQTRRFGRSGAGHLDRSKDFDAGTDDGRL